jgi:hypothetical protein
MKMTVTRWSVVGAIVVAIGVALAARQHEQVPSISLAHAHLQPWQVSPLEYQRKLATEGLRRLELEAAPYERASFGPSTRSVGFRSPVAVAQAYSWPNGAMVIVTSRTDPPGSMRDIQELASLYNGVLRRIAIGTTSSARSYSSIDLSCGSRGMDPVACAGDFSGHTYFFLVKPDSVFLLGSHVGKPTDVYTLADGESCTAEPNPQSRVAVWAARGESLRRPLITKSRLFAASRGLVDSTTLLFETVRCFHLGSIDLLNIGDRSSGVVYMIDHGKATVVTRGEVLTSGARHILIFREESSGDMIDYLEVFSR